MGKQRQHHNSSRTALPQQPLATTDDAIDTFIRGLLYNIDKQSVSDPFGGLPNDEMTDDEIDALFDEMVIRQTENLTGIKVSSMEEFNIAQEALSNDAHNPDFSQLTLLHAGASEQLDLAPFVNDDGEMLYPELTGIRVADSPEELENELLEEERKYEKQLYEQLTNDGFDTELANYALNSITRQQTSAQRRPTTAEHNAMVKRATSRMNSKVDRLVYKKF